MKMFRKLVSIVSAATLLTSSLAFAVPASAAVVPQEAEVSSEPKIQANVQDGLILHAFNWSFSTIKDNLPAIAEAGYSTIQTSPVQQPKDYGTSTDVGGQWWKPYQPVSLSFAKNTWFGTKADLTALCTEADKYGIKIIVDIVSNHLGNNLEASPLSVSEQVKTYEPSIYSPTASGAYWHSLNTGASDGNQQSIVQGHIGMPDLNTSNSTVQNLVKNLLKDCIDCGVDGFRFDAAKHIETPNDGSYSSQYWPNVINYAKQQYKAKTGKDGLYVYGEILNTPGNGRQYGWYTPYLNVTDNKTGNGVLSSVRGNNAGGAAFKSYQTGLPAKNVVLWAESHDTYMNPEDMNYSKGATDSQIIKAWSMVASRKDATALFFARPGNAKMGEASGNGTYKSTVVSEINKFHNNFVGQSEKVGNSGSYAYVVRGTSGIVITNISGNAGKASISGTGMANGTYVDTVTGNEFTVSGGTVSGNIGSTGVAVVYKSTSTPKASSSAESGSFQGETMVTTLTCENCVSATYCLDNSTPVAFTNGTAIRIGSDYNYGDTINLTLTATDKSGVKKTSTYKFKKEKSTGSGVYIFFDKAHSGYTTWNEPFNAWIFDEETASKKPTYAAAPGWPGLQMEYDSASGMYYVEVPKTCYALTTNGTTTTTTTSDFDLSKSSKTCVIINGTLNTGKLGQYPTDGSATKLRLNGQSHILGKSGRTSWDVTNITPKKTEVQATNVTKGQSQQPTTATQQQETFASKFNVTASSNFFPKNTTSYDASTKKLTVTYFINCNYGMVNSQWKLTYDKSALKFDMANNSYTNDDDELVSTVMPKAPSAVINENPADLSNGIRGNCSSTKLFKLCDKNGNQVPFVSVTFDVLKPVDTTVNLDIEELALSYIRPGQSESSDEDDQILIAGSKVKDVTPGYTLVTSNHAGGYDETYVNASDPKIVKNGSEQPTQATEKPTQKPTEATQKPTNPPTPVLLGYFGDIDLDGDVTVDDVTMLQLYLNRERAKLNDLQKILADVDNDGDITVDDVTAIQMYLNKRKQPTERTGDPYYGYEDSTQEPTQAQPTNANGYTVTATSNFFPENSVTFDKSEKLITVTYYMQCEKDLLDAQWELTYDKSVLQYTDENNSALNADDELYSTVMPCASDAVINPEPEGVDNAIDGNFSSLKLAKLSHKLYGRVGFVSVTFNVLKPVDTTVDLKIREMSVSKRESGQSQANAEDEEQLLYNYQANKISVPYTIATAIYAGKFSAGHSDSSSDEVINVKANELPVYPTKPTKPTDPATSPDPNGFTVTATSNFFPQNKVTFNNSTKQITVTYFMECEKDLLDTQWELTYDKSVLKYTDANNTATGSDDESYSTVMPCAKDALINPTPSDSDSAIDGNFTSLKLAKLSNKTNGKVGFVSVTFDVVNPADTTVDLKVRELSLSKREEGQSQASEENEEQLLYNFTSSAVTVPYTLTTAIYSGKFNAAYNDSSNAVMNVQAGQVPASNPPAPVTVPTEYVEPTEESHTDVIPTDEPPTDEPPTNPSGTFYFSDSLKWGDIHVYAWDAEGNALTAEWPGDAGVEGEMNPFGEMVYTINVPEGAAGVVINGGGNQTADITDFNPQNGGYYVSADQTSTNEQGATVYIAIPWPDEIPTGEVPPTDSDNPPIPGSFYFTDALGWGDIHVYAWDASGTALTAEWPGDAGVEGEMNPYSQMVYTINVPEGAAGVIVNGAGGQTENITNFAPEGGGYFVDGSQTTINEFGSTVYVAIPWGGPVPPTDSDNPVPPSGTFYFSDSLHWGDIHVYAWDASGTALTAEWPGDSGIEGEMNPYGEMVYTINVPEGAAGVIVNGTGGQTDNITDFNPADGGYYVLAGNTTVNEFGAIVYVPIPWGNPVPPTGGGDGGSFKFSDSLGWGSIRVYAYNDSGDVGAAWPGTEAPQVETNEYGQAVYSISVPAGATGVVINGNNGQTENITNFAPGGGGYYVSAGNTTVNEFGATVYVAIPWDNTDPNPNPNPNPNPDPVPGGRVTLNATGYDNDGAHFYAWTWGDGEGHWVQADGDSSDAAHIYFSNLESHVIFVRMNPAENGNPSWDYCWNQTGNLDTQYGGTFTLNGWGLDGHW